METIAKGMTCGPEGCSIAAHAAAAKAAKSSAGAKIRIEMFSDFICPWCLLGATELDDLRGKYDFKLAHLGIELFPDLPAEGVKLADSPMAAHLPGALNKINSIRDLGMKLPEVISNTRNAILAEDYAEENGKAHEYDFAVWDAVFRKGINVSSESAVGKIIAKIGLDPDKVSKYTRDEERIRKLEERERVCRDTGRYDIPNFIVNGDYSVEGYVPAAKWSEIFDSILGGKPQGAAE
jgi:predicted DsbA family dithiol-disulfide isomerase